MNISIFRSLRFRMPIVVLAGVIPLILIAILYASDRAIKKIRQEAKENMALKAELLAESINRWDELNALAVINLTKQPDIISMNPTSQQAVLKKTVDTYEHFYLAMTTDLGGWNVARSDEPKKVYFGDRDWFLGAKAGKELTYQTLIGRTTKRLALCLSAPIRDSQPKILGVTVGCTDLGDLAKQVGKLKFGKTGYAILVDESGTVLAHPNPEFVSGKKLKDLSFYPPVKYFLSGGSGHFSFKDYEDVNQDDKGVRWVSYDVPLNNNWGIVVVQQEAEFLQNERDFQNLAFSIAFVSVLGVSLVTWFLGNRLIDPIDNLTSAASAISDGQLDRRVEIKRKDELGILAHSFNSMAERLKSFFDNLEQQIEKRTIQLKEAKEVAEAANLAKDRFLANISHELRTPLNSILGYTRVILKDDKLAPYHAHDLKIVERSGTHLLTLINDILSFSKTQAGKLELHPTNLQLAKFLRELVELVSMWAKEKNIAIKTEWNNLPPGIQVDETRLRQILINLLSNAIKFTNEGSVTLKIKVLDRVKYDGSLSQQKLRFEVIDTGVGMIRPELEKIFEPFEQVGDIESRVAGTGLGLSISKQLVELMGGKLKVKSTLRVGSTFWFDLTVPVVKIVKQIDPRIAGKISNYKIKPHRLLIVDDREENRLLLVKILQPKGFKIATANNGHEMLKMALSFQPDLILMDLFMPEKTGFTAAKELRRMPQFKHTPIIIVTASSITQENVKYLQAEAILHKPINEEELLITLHKNL